ncbi:MAG: subtilisin family serine protease [Bacteriovoracaceae bacterium]|jgi:subtilisin family serine protease
MKLIVTLLFFISAFNLSADEIRFNNKRIIVKLKEGQAMPSHQSVKKVQHLFKQLYVLHLEDVKSLETDFLNSPAFEYVERDFYSGRNKLPQAERELEINEKMAGDFNDPKFGKLWHFNDKTGMSVNRAYKEVINAKGSEVIVAVVDTGVDYNHEDLKEVMWVNTKEIPGNNIDDDGNGYVDDVHGINTLSRDSNGSATGDMKDTHSHGTHVSGIIGATQNNNVGIAGVASNVKIMGIRTVPNNGDELDVDVIESFLYAAKNGAKIINCSFGKAHNEGGMAVSETIKHIGETYGVLVIAASGNSSQNIDSRLTYPASFENDHLMVIASTSNRGGMSYFSNYGKKNVDLAAPGSSVYSTTPNNRYSSMSGTSMASPAAAGVAAEVLSHNPALGPVELKTLLMDSTTKVGRFSSKLVTGGRINLYNALQQALNR